MPAIYRPPAGFSFLVKFDFSPNVFDVSFQSVSGLSVEYEFETYKEGGENRFEHKLPVRTKYSDLVLKRGFVFAGSHLYQWCQRAFRDRDFQPANVIVSLLNEAFVPLKTWTVVHAVPKKWSLSDFNASENAVVVETLELSYQYFEVIPPF
ncbi:MAG: phage tail protein [Bacteroidetes bacterium]|nr:phage tail protein [Bacteroidota bacterium]